MYITKHEPSGKLWTLGNNDVYQCRFILGKQKKKSTILVSDIDNRGGYAGVGAGSIEEISVPSCQICCKPRTALIK